MRREVIHAAALEAAQLLIHDQGSITMTKDLVDAWQASRWAEHRKATELLTTMPTMQRQRTSFWQRLFYVKPPKHSTYKEGGALM